jgi:acyl-CoA synthetase (NDP forming)
MRLAQALFAPRAVALVGASGDARKNTARPQRYLRQHGYRGRVVPINAARADVFGEKSYGSVAAVPGDIDHAFIMVEDVERALEDCGTKRVPVASIYSDGFADKGNLERQQALVARARALGVRLLGPNSMGVIDASSRLALSVNAVLEMERLPAGGVSVVSQSGTMLGTLLSRGAARGLGFAKLVSVGNEADLGVGELVELLAEDADTRVVLLFLETLRDAGRLAYASRKAHMAGKPVVAYKLGRSALGEAMARSHTGALAGADAALDAYFRDCGIVRVDMLETLLEAAPLLEGRHPPNLERAGRVAAVSTTGGGAATVVDRLGLRGVELAAMHDLTMAATPEGYRETLERLLAAPDCDAVVAVVGSSAQFHPELAVQPIVQCARADKPLAAFMTPHAEASLALCAARGVAAFRTPEACADALAAFLAWRAPRSAPARALPGLPSQPFELFAALGIPVAPWQIARAPDFVHDIPYPVAIKLAGVAHKTEKQGVILGIRNETEFREAAGRLHADEVLVQGMRSALGEAIVGYRLDPVVGPTVLVGAGGVLAEVYRDVAVRIAPVTVEEAAAMIAEVKGFAPLSGYRGLPRGDLEALARAIAAVSQLAGAHDIAEAEINPLLVSAQGVVAVDALVVRKE